MIDKAKYPKEFLELIKKVTNKRTKIIIDHILKHGFITTQELEEKYGYNHPPRAARDVRELGIPLETFKVKSSDNKSIAAYRFGDLSQIPNNFLAGRKIFSKEFKKKLFELSDCKCFICNGTFEERYLQIDHKVPYQIAGNDTEAERNIADLMFSGKMMKWFISTN